MPSNFEATIASYQAAETLIADGKVRAIGVSNFGPMHLKTLMERTEVCPTVNQIELHPYFIQRKMRETNSRYGIVTEACSPLGRSVRDATASSTLKDPLAPTVVELAAKYRGPARPNGPARARSGG